MSVCSIMVVEDDFDIREVVADLLTAEGYEVIIAANGREALDYLESRAPPCVILLDLMMPVMNGWQFLEMLRKDCRLSQVPVVVVTASPSSVSGANALIRKPFDLDDLVRTVSRFCSCPRPPAPAPG